MYIIIKKIIYLSLFFFSTNLFALTDDQVRVEIKKWADTQDLPQDLDEITSLLEIKIATRGIVYNYKLKLDQNEIVNFPQAFKNIKSKALSSLCEKKELSWYKENKVEMIYTYVDKNDNFVTIFKIHASQC